MITKKQKTFVVTYENPYYVEGLEDCSKTLEVTIKGYDKKQLQSVFDMRMLVKYPNIEENPKIVSIKGG